MRRKSDALEIAKPFEQALIDRLNKAAEKIERKKRAIKTKRTTPKKKSSTEEIILEPRRHRTEKIKSNLLIQPM